mmetsp:Transcript_37768/g.61783  ORF Transcript_37768/g.61783 Transcript_37768/m.61783 type:complete len:87 (+) Transcript_37768:205-465(+)
MASKEVPSQGIGDLPTQDIEATQMEPEHDTESAGSPAFKFQSPKKASRPTLGEIAGAKRNSITHDATNPTARERREVQSVFPWSGD